MPSGAADAKKADQQGYVEPRDAHTAPPSPRPAAPETEIRFAVGTGFTDAQREKPPAIGATITFRYQELTDGGVPRFPSFVRSRVDS